MSKSELLTILLYIFGMMLWILGKHPMNPMNYFAGAFIGCACGFAARGVFERRKAKVNHG